MERFLEALRDLVTAQRLQGLVVGAIATMVIGLYGFWTTDGNARAMAATEANAEVVEVLAPICAAQAGQDPDIDAKLEALRAISSSYEQRKFITDAGWATFGDLTLTSRRLNDIVVMCRGLLLDEQAA